MQSAPSAIIEQLRNELRDVEGIVLEPSDDLLLQSFVDEMYKAGGISQLEGLLSQRPSRIGSVFHYWLDHLYDMYGKFFTDFRDFKALRHTCIASLLQENEDKTLKIWCIEPGSGQEAYSLALMLDRAVPELKDWTIELHTSNQRHRRFQRCKGARFTTLELSQGLPDGMVNHLIEADFEDGGFLVKGDLSRHLVHHHTPILEAPSNLPPCDIVLMRGIYQYMGETQAKRLLALIHEKLRPGGYLLLSRSDRVLNSKYFQRHNTIHGSALYTKTTTNRSSDSSAEPLPKATRQSVHSLEPKEYKQMVRHLDQLKLLDGVSVGDHDKFMRQFEIKEFTKGSEILREGEPNTSLYGIIAGNVSIWVGTGLLRRPQQLTSLGQGQLIGEGSSLSRSICTATAIAESDLRVFEIKNETLRLHYNNNPFFASKVNAMLKRRADERHQFQRTNKSIKASTIGNTREGMSLVNEDRYILDEYSLPKGVLPTPVTEDLLQKFKEFSRDTKLFSALPLAAVETIANLLCAVKVEPEVTIIKEGTWPIGFYLICEGEADVYKGGGFFRLGSKVAQISEGTFIGETSVILGQKASASVISKTPMLMCALSRELFEYIYNSHEEFALEIDQICADRN